MTYEEALALIKMPKWLYENGALLNSKSIQQVYPMTFRLEMSSKDMKKKFLLDVKQSKKFGIRLNFQMMDDTNLGISRLDYNSNHQNPETLTKEVPVIFHTHVGEFFINRSHLHFQIEGYPNLVWALPLEETEIDVKEVTVDNMPSDFILAFESFIKYLNVQTQIAINPMLI